MHYSFLIVSLFSVSLIGSAQQDPAAKEILDRVAEKNKQYISIQANFELIIENRREDQTSVSSGIIKIKGEKYYMESMGTKVFFNGTTIWSYMEDINEVTISEPDQNSDDIIENPVMIFDFYNRDFKYRLVGEAKLDEGWMYEIDLFPNSLQQPYSRFKIYIKRDTEELFMLKAVGKDGIDYVAYLKNMKYNEELSNDYFEFDPSRHKGIEVIDLRF
jgi:outer membrane lipoprotein-sorting protein